MAFKKGVSGNKSGRPKGAKNLRTTEIAEKVIEQGITPLEVLVTLMRKNWSAAASCVIAEDQAALEQTAAGYARDAAPYLHAKLQPIDSKGSTDSTINVYMKQFPKE